MRQSSVAPWYRLHAVTWLAVATVAAALAWLNALFDAHALLRGGHTYVHGWPVWFAERLQTSESSRWYDAKFVIAFRVGWFAADIAVAVMILAGTAWVVETRTRKHSIALRFSVESLFVLMAWSACIFWRETYGGWMLHWWPYILRGAASAVAYIAVALAWLAAFEAADAAWKRLAMQRAEPSE